MLAFQCHVVKEENYFVMLICIVFHNLWHVLIVAYDVIKVLDAVASLSKTVTAQGMFFTI